VPVVYTAWSVGRYFGIPRALGGDHFRQEYRELPLVREGAFKYSSNAMYAFVFLVFWAIALLTGSRAALASALFQHAYIWVHFYCTEEPDMQVIYGGRYPAETG
jgi:protein-S-isoprenylcysteine O-methyltransferase Ste14